jgi:hypothetical protein
MPDFDANDALSSLSGAGPGRLIAPSPRRLAILDYLDVVVVIVALPIALVLGAPVFGCLVGAGAWVVQRILAGVDRRWLSRSAERRFGLPLVEAFGRIWLLAGAIVLAGAAGGRADGLTAALMIFGAYSVAFAMRLLDGRPTGGPER